MFENARRLTLFAGHYGSGKTNVALNYARGLKRAKGGRVVIADLDIVNPYFRTSDSAAALAREGIELVVSEYANTNVDLAAIPREIYSVVKDPSLRAVLDVGGDDRGALALGRYVEAIRAGADYEMLAVVNFARPLTTTVADAVEVLREIETAGGLPFTGIVNNTNLGPETTVETVVRSEELAEGLARELGLPLRLTTVASGLGYRGKNVIELEIQKLYYQMEMN